MPHVIQCGVLLQRGCSWAPFWSLKCQIGNIVLSWTLKKHVLWQNPVILIEICVLRVWAVLFTSLLTMHNDNIPFLPVKSVTTPLVIYFVYMKWQSNSILLLNRITQNVSGQISQTKLEYWCYCHVYSLCFPRFFVYLVQSCFHFPAPH